MDDRFADIRQGGDSRVPIIKHSLHAVEKAPTASIESSSVRRVCGGLGALHSCDHLWTVYRTAQAGRFTVRYRRCCLCRATSKTVQLLPTVDEMLSEISHQWNTLASDPLHDGKLSQ